MKVKKLIKELKKLDENAIVIMSRDSEGNGYSPLSGLFTGLYIPDSTWSGDVYYDGYEDDMDSDEVDDLREDGKLAVILDPVN